MNMRKNARLTPIGRERLVRMMLSGQTPLAAMRRRKRATAGSNDEFLATLLAQT
jgi:hypothetical protein